MKICVTAESTCDLPSAYLEENNIKTIPLAIVKDGQEFFDGVNISSLEIFDYVNKGGDLPKTAARSVENYNEFFTKSLTGYDALIHVAFSSELSCSYQNAYSASQNFKNVYVVDSKNLSSGHGLVVMSAIDLINQGKDINSIIEELTKIVQKVRTSFVLNTMKFLAKGGRCSTLTSIAASLLQLKPSIKVAAGKMTVSKKYLGKINSCVSKYIDDTLSQYPECRKDKIFLTYSSVGILDIETFKNKLYSYGFRQVYESFSNCTISSHCGPNCIGILFIDK